MVVCHCRAVNDCTILAAVEAGARDHRELAQVCGAGGRCGGCLPALRALLADHGIDLAAAADRAA